MKYFDTDTKPSAAAVALRDLLSDMKEARTPTHNVDMGIGISAAIDEANEALIAEGLEPVEPFTWRDHGDELELIRHVTDVLETPGAKGSAELLTECYAFLANRGGYRVRSLYEPKGEGNGWADCDPSIATLWTIEDDRTGDAIEAVNTRDEAVAWIKAHTSDA